MLERFDKIPKETENSEVLCWPVNFWQMDLDLRGCGAQMAKEKFNLCLIPWIDLLLMEIVQS